MGKIREENVAVATEIAAERRTKKRLSQNRVRIEETPRGLLDKMDFCAATLSIVLLHVLMGMSMVGDRKLGTNIEQVWVRALHQYSDGGYTL